MNINIKNYFQYDALNYKWHVHGKQNLQPLTTSTNI